MGPLTENTFQLQYKEATLRSEYMPWVKAGSMAHKLQSHASSAIWVNSTFGWVILHCYFDILNRFLFKLVFCKWDLMTDEETDMWAEDNWVYWHRLGPVGTNSSKTAASLHSRIILLYMEGPFFLLKFRECGVLSPHNIFTRIQLLFWVPKAN